MSLTWDASNFFAHMDLKEGAAQRVAEQRLGDAVDDLARIASNIAPIETGLLRRSIRKSIKAQGGAISGEVSFTAIESGGSERFNYALWTHEYMDDSQVKVGGGSDGYTIGPKYLQRPLEGEKSRYLKLIADGVKGALD